MYYSGMNFVIEWYDFRELGGMNFVIGWCDFCDRGHDPCCYRFQDRSRGSAEEAYNLWHKSVFFLFPAP